MSKILIIEDEDSIAELEKDYLELSDFTVDIEKDGKKGLVRALHGSYDLVILDLMLPSMDGFDICKEISAQKRFGFNHLKFPYTLCLTLLSRIRCVHNFE